MTKKSESVSQEDHLSTAPNECQVVGKVMPVSYLAGHFQTMELLSVPSSCYVSFLESICLGLFYFVHMIPIWFPLLCGKSRKISPEYLQYLSVKGKLKRSSPM